MAGVIGRAGYPILNQDETKILGIAIPIGVNFHVFNNDNEEIGEHWQLQDAANLLAPDQP